MFHSLLEIRKQLQQNITSQQLLEWQLPWSLSGVVLPPFCSYSLLYLCSPAIFHCSDHFHLTKMSHLLFSTTICRPLISNPPQTSLSTWAWLWGILPAFAICTCILSQSLKTVLLTGEYIMLWDSRYTFKMYSSTQTCAVKFTAYHLIWKQTWKFLHISQVDVSCKPESHQYCITAKIAWIIHIYMC